MSHGRILLADNLKVGLIATSEYLERAGYEVIQACTLEETLEILRQSWVHLAILDVRLVDDDDPEDISGILLAKNKEFQSTPKILLTGFPTYQAVRDALGSRMGELPPAVAFVDKNEGPEKLLEAVQEAFGQYVGVNTRLKVRWLADGLHSFSHILSLIEPELYGGRTPERMEELEDLFRMRFNSYDELVVSDLMWANGGRACLEVFAYTGEEEEHLLLTCGKVQAIRDEPGRDKKAFQKSNNLWGETRVAETLHFGLMGRDITRFGPGKIKRFDRRLIEMPEKQTRTILEKLYEGKLTEWQQRRSGRELVEPQKGSPIEMLGRLELANKLPTEDELRSRLENLANEGYDKGLVEEITLTADHLIVSFSNQARLVFPDPLARLYADELFSEGEAAWGTTLGNLNTRNLILVSDSECIPSDFSTSGARPILADYLSLEADIRFRVLERSNLSSIFNFEQELLKAGSLLDPIPAGNVEPEFRKALAAILAIRGLASKGAGSTLEAYLRGLYFYTIRELLDYEAEVRHTQDETTHWLHCLLLAASITQAVEAVTEGTVKDNAADQMMGIEINEIKHQVRVRGKRVLLTPTEYNILLYLYQNEGRLCQRLDILREGLKIQKPDEKAERGLLNTNIGRLRKKIEVNPRQPKHLLTVQGEGYRLVLKTE